jgi:hypothetical protein
MGMPLFKLSPFPILYRLKIPKKYCDFTILGVLSAWEIQSFNINQETGGWYRHIFKNMKYEK